jgi:hypothetical protein
VVVGWTLRIPFGTTSRREIEPGTILLDERAWELSFRNPFYVLQARNFPSEEAARTAIPEVVAALIWSFALRNEGVQVEIEPQRIALRDTPSPPDSQIPGVFGIGNEGSPAIYPDEKAVAFAHVFPVTVKVSTAFSNFADALRDAYEMPGIDRLVRDDQLRLAVDVFGSSFFETSPFARALTCVGGLEVMKDQDDLPPTVREVIDRWDIEAQRLNIDVSEKQALRSRIAQLRRPSIGGAIFDLVQKRLDDADAKRAKRFYDLRSKLLHDWDKAAGEELERRAPELAELVRDLLVALMRDE